VPGPIEGMLHGIRAEVLGARRALVEAERHVVWHVPCTLSPTLARILSMAGEARAQLDRIDGAPTVRDTLAVLLEKLDTEARRAYDSLAAVREATRHTLTDAVAVLGIASTMALDALGRLERRTECGTTRDGGRHV